MARELDILHEDHLEEDLVITRVEWQTAAHHLVPAREATIVLYKY